MSTSHQEQLASLFERLFVRSEELHRHIVGIEGGIEVLRAMPAATAPLADHAFQAVLALEARGMVGSAFFHHLVAARPHREAEIASVAAKWLPGGIVASAPVTRAAGGMAPAPLACRWASNSTIYNGPTPVRIMVSCAASYCRVHWTTPFGDEDTELREGCDIVITSQHVWLTNTLHAHGQFIIYG